MKIKPSTLIAASIACLPLASHCASGTASAYLTDQRDAAVRSSHALCWRTSYWTPAMAREECDPQLVPRASAVAEPPPQPVMEPPPAAAVVPTRQKFELSADALFDFDKANLRSDGKDTLDALYQRIAGTSLEVLIVVGHADRIGRESYNLALSQRRAEAVKAYLIGKGVDAGRIHAEGRGEREPVTANACRRLGPDSRRNAKLIACLQPDRRVEVEVVGTRQAN